MTTKSIGKVTLTTDSTGKTKLKRVHAFASKAARAARSKTKRVTSPAKARAAR